MQNFFFIAVFFYITASLNVMANTIPLNGDNEPQFGSSSLMDDSSEFSQPEEDLLWLENMKDYLSSYTNDFSTYIDHALASPKDDEVLENRSYIGLRSMAEYSHYGDFHSDARVVLRIDLPNTQHKWHIIFETDGDDNNSLESKERDSVQENVSNESNTAIGGIGIEEGLWTFWKTNFDIGVKIKLPLDPFTRAELRRVEDISDSWAAQFKQQVFYYYSTGAGSLTSLSFYHGLDEDKKQIVTAGTSAQYLYDDRRWELVTSVGLSDRINRKHLLAYSAGVSVDPHESDKVTSYWLSLSWYQNLYKNWLYLMVTPKIDIPRAYDYEINPGIQMNLEVFFSKNRKIDRLKRSIPKSTRYYD